MGSRSNPVRHEVSFEQLVDYVENRLGPDEVRRVSEHLEGGCACCAEDVLWLRRVLGLMASDELVDAPAPVRRRAEELYRRRRRVPQLSLADLWARLRLAPNLRHAAVVTLVTLLVLSGVWWGWGNANVAQAATLAEVQGPVEVRISEAAGWQPARPGMALAAGMALRSGQGGWAVLAYPDGSHTYLFGGAEVEILSLTGQRNRHSLDARLRQRAGRTTHDLASRQSSIQVETAAATAQACAASYEVAVSGEEVEVQAASGEVTLQAGDEKARLSQGEQGWVAGGHVVIATPTLTATAAASDRPTAWPTATSRPAEATREPPATNRPQPVPTATAQPAATRPGRGHEKTPEPTRTPKDKGRKTPKATAAPEPQPSAIATVETAQPLATPHDGRQKAPWGQSNRGKPRPAATVQAASAKPKAGRPTRLPSRPRALAS